MKWHSSWFATANQLNVQTFPQETDFRDAAIAAADVVWERGLLRRLGLCHGISGNTYVFLSLYRIVGGKEHLFRARQFAGWLHKHAKRLLSTGEMHGGDHRHSLFEGLAGTACLWIDVARPENSRFPGYEIWKWRGNVTCKWTRANMWIIACYKQRKWLPSRSLTATLRCSLRIETVK